MKVAKVEVFSSGFDEIVKGIRRKNEIKPYPKINNIGD